MQKFSFEEVVQFQNRAGALLERMKDNKSRFTYAIERVLPQLQSVHKKWNQLVSDVDYEFCEVKNGDGEGKGAILYDEQGRLMFTRENKKKADQKKEKESTVKKFEIDPYYVRFDSIPELTEFELNILSGFIINPEHVDKIRKDRELKFGNQVEENNSNGDSEIETHSDNHE